MRATWSLQAMQFPRAEKALVDALDHHFIGQAVPQVLDLWEQEKQQSVRPPDRGLSVKEEPYTTNDAMRRLPCVHNQPIHLLVSASPNQLVNNVFLSQ